MYKLTYYPWITQHVDPQEIARQIRRFADTLQVELKKAKATTVDVEVLPPLEVLLQIAAIAKNACEIALMNPLGYVFARARNCNFAAVALAQRIIDHEVGDVYYSQIYTSTKTAISALSNMKGRSIGFGVSYSTSNFLVPAYELKKRGLHPLSAFSRVEHLGGHDLVAKAVYEGRIDLGAGHDGVIVDLAAQCG